MARCPSFCNNRCDDSFFCELEKLNHLHPKVVHCIKVHVLCQENPKGHWPFGFSSLLGDSKGAGVNDMPVACQSRDPARSAERANPRWSTKRITRRGAEGGRVTAPDFGIRSCVPWKNLLLFYRKKKLSPGIQTAVKQLMTSADRRGTGFFDMYKRTTHRRNGL